MRASKARSVVLVVVTVLAITNVAMIAGSASWRHAGGTVSFMLAVALTAAVIVLARGRGRGRD